MDVVAYLDELQQAALKDEALANKLIATRQESNPLQAFCKVCQELGYPIYAMDLINAGEEFYAAMRRSTNGGGENAPKLEGEDDFYEMFFAALQNHYNKKENEYRRG